MIVSLTEAKQWLRIDGTDDDSLLNTIVEIVEEKITELNPSPEAIASKRAKHLCLVTICDMYENRDVSISEKTEKSIRAAVNELIYKYGEAT